MLFQYFRRIVVCRTTYHFQTNNIGKLLYSYIVTLYLYLQSKFFRLENLQKLYRLYLSEAFSNVYRNV